MTPEAFGLQAAATGGDLPEEWQALLADQVAVLAALLLQMQSTMGYVRKVLYYNLCLLFRRFMDEVLHRRFTQMM
jgi:hypothetical protein